jgi:hypothetical protein
LLRNVLSTAASAAAPDGMQQLLREEKKRSYLQTIVWPVQQSNWCGISELPSELGQITELFLHGYLLDQNHASMI